VLDNHEFDLWVDDYDKQIEISDKNGEFPFAGYRTILNATYGIIMGNAPANVLDIGIGTGRLAFSLYKAGNTITGIDFSNEMLKHSRAKMPNASLILHDFSKDLPDVLDNTTFDFIISTYALHHLTDALKIELIRTLLDHLDASGAIIIGDIGFLSRNDMENCKKAYYDDWDEDEYFFVFPEFNDQLSRYSTYSYHQISHCAGMLEIRPFA